MVSRILSLRDVDHGDVIGADIHCQHGRKPYKQTVQGRLHT